MTKSRKVLYWATTGWIAFSFVLSGIFDVLQLPMVMEITTTLGYPAYFMIILGTWKILGGLAILAPGTPRLKEWAYAGIAFDLSSATLSHLAVEHINGKLMAPIVLLGLAVVSWALRPEDRKLEARARTLSARGPSLEQQPVFSS